jgi:hypothetical protein
MMRHRTRSYGRGSIGMTPSPARRRKLLPSHFAGALVLLIFVGVQYGSLREMENYASQSEPFSFPSAAKYALKSGLGRNRDSLSILMAAVTDTDRPVWDDEIVPSVESERCERYGWTYDKSRTKRRRIFAGSLIADDSWHAIGFGAMESYGIYSALALVESNRTPMFYERKLRFGTDSDNVQKLQSGIYGPDTRVTVDYHVDENSGIVGLIRDMMPREMILHRWKQSGMQADDIGLVMDLDEMFSRDFLRAAQICDVPSFRLDEQDCRRVKLISRALVFEVSPECIRGNNLYWGHPDMIIGKCVDQIGDADTHKPPRRVHFNDGWRAEGYYGKYLMMPNTTQFPLWNAADFRMIPGFKQPGSNITHTGYHFHNFFTSFDQIRLKYETYSHPVQGARNMALGELHQDVDLFVKCAMNRQGGVPRLLGGLKEVKGDIPLALQVKDYVSARHEEMRKALAGDEATYGTAS